jgi:uncharacterized delta-60 repeat protein
VAVQADGKIVMAGNHQNDFALARYDGAGNLDNTFGAGGKVTTDISSYDAASAIALQSDGKILVAGGCNASSNDFSLLRYNTDGSLDTTFGTGGIVVTDFAGNYDVCSSMALQQDGRIVLAGFTLNSVNYDFALSRYLSDGSPDAAFGIGGKVQTDLGSDFEYAYSVLIHDDGSIIVGGARVAGPVGHFTLIRYDSVGHLDSAFAGGSGALVTVPVGTGNSQCVSVSRRPDGRIVMGGVAVNGQDYDFAIAQLNYSTFVYTGLHAPWETGEGVTVFPNPFSVTTTIRLPVLVHQATLNILDLQGRKVKSVASISGTDIDVDRDGLAAGVYVVHLISDNKVLATEKIVIVD